MGHLRVVLIALFAAAVIVKLFYLVTKTIRIVVLKTEQPMAGFDSEPPVETPVVDAPIVVSSGTERMGVVQAWDGAEFSHEQLN